MPDWRWVHQLTLRLRTLFRRDRIERELDEELQFHIEERAALEMARGLSPAEARLTALRAMGGVEQRKEECRDVLRVAYIDDLVRDLRYAGRSLRRSPGFTAIAVLIMALGIGANTAVFSVVNAVLLKPLAYRDPNRIVTLSTRVTGGAAGAGEDSIDEQVSIPNFQDWHDQSSSFEAMAYYGSREVPVMAGGSAEYARGTQVGPEFFRVFAVEPVVGRSFSADEMKAGGGGVALISYPFWQSHFGGNAGVLKQVLRVYDKSLRIIGVLPPSFGFPDNTDVWVLATVSSEDMKYRGAQNWQAVARLKPRVALEQAKTEIATIALRLEQQYPDVNKGRTTGVTRLRDRMVGNVRLTLYLLLGAVSVVLLIACANTATLLLGRATARTREIAVRAALGASRRRIVRQLITESFALALGAGVAGVLLAWQGSKALVALAPAGLPRLAEAGLDRSVLAFALGVSLITTFLFGLVPALYASKVDLNGALKQAGNRSATGGGMVRVRGALVVTEVALSVALLAGAGLLIRSLAAVYHVALGFQPEHVLVMRATVPAPSQAPIAAGFFQDLLPKIARVPGVLSAGATMAPPGEIESSGGYFIDHLPARPDWTSAPGAVLSVVAPGTFAALGIPLKRGRDFNDGDTAEKPLVAVVNEALVRKSFPNRNPIGRTIFCPYDSFKGLTIVGVSGDVRQRGPASEPTPECYMTYRQHPFNGNTLSIVARTAGDRATFVATFRRLAREVSPDVPMKFTTMEEKLSENVAAPRFRTLLFGVFAGLAVCLAMAGVYGVMAYAVAQRSNEIGLRIALGAGRSSVFRLVLGEGVVLAGLGLALGFVVAVTGTRLLASMLFQVRPHDPVVYLAIAILLGVVTLIAGFVPARRASGIDPLAAMRQE
jgi:putative ABC transport system permease protein